MRAGRLRHLVSLEANLPGDPNDYGEVVPQWVVAGATWADISPVSLSGLRGAKEVLMGGAETNQDIVNITMHPRRDITITPDVWRVRYESHVYDVKAVRLNNIGDELVLVCAVGAEG
jgi:head-tail adaptor